MKTHKFYFILVIGLLLVSCQYEIDTQKDSTEDSTETEQVKQQKFAIAIHGGAGAMSRELMSDSLENAYKAKLEEAVNKGHDILAEGGSSVEAVQASINILEDSPLFNAGKGAVLNHREKPELDASIMEGKTLNAGAVAGVSHIKNPIDLAIAVMENSKHVMLGGAGAEEFAKEQGFEFVPDTYFITERRLKAVRAAKQKEKSKTAYYDQQLKADKMGTVGCVALDQEGNLAAGTSTGGINNKMYGRIGDSPIIGAGNYANNKTCAVSATGAGEYYIRGSVAYDMSALMEYSGLTVEEAAQKIIYEKQPALGGSGGLIAMDKYGQVSMEFNTSGMFRAYMDEDGNLTVGIYE
ncbi:MAG TPA: isoaspartyl peptidase/L-asparaginase [Flavobacteriaceae bacterium]|nr:isoaspartyl peptidase/L-asparaginase [Flavobacteriaceae bacterium]